MNIKAGSAFADYDIYRELSPRGVAACAWETVVYDGDLDGVETFLVAPSNAEEVKATPEIALARGAEAQRMVRFFARSRERYMASSDRAQRVYAPAGSTHQFVYEHPDFVVDAMRDIVRR